MLPDRMNSSQSSIGQSSIGPTRSTAHLIHGPRGNGVG